jgi:hypothetical protein
LNQIYNNYTDIILCGDLNINTLHGNYRKQLSDSLLASYSLHSSVKFPTSIHSGSYTTIDNSVINTFKYNKYSVCHLVDGLCDHDAVILSISNIIMQDSRNLFHLSRKFHIYSIRDFNFHLSYEIWEDVFTDNNVNLIFNNFLKTYLRIFYASFSI